jgi:transglycosylase-like protein
VRSRFPLSLLGLAALILFAVAGSAFARESVRPDRPVSAQALRALADHYRIITWTFQRAAHVKRTPSSLSYRRSGDPAYLQWTIDTWTHRANVARGQALARVHKRLSVALPTAPALHSKLSRRLAYTKTVTIKIRRVYPGRVTPAFAAAHGKNGNATLRLWQRRLASSALSAVVHARRSPAAAAVPDIPDFLRSAFLCIHHYEGAWTSNTGNGYYGGLQMDVSFQSSYGGDYLRRWGTADRWPAWAQIHTAVRAYQSGRGFYPWPNTARACGLL